MFPSISFDFLNWAFRLLLAQAITLFFFLLNVVNFSLPHAGDFKPFFLLMAVYYWAIFRPTVMPPLYTFVLGVVMDFQTGTPPGLSALVMIALQLLVQKSRLFLMGQNYVTVWLGFALVALANALSLWLAACLFTAPISISPFLIATLFSIFLFPLASLLLQFAHRRLPIPLNVLRS